MKNISYGRQSIDSDDIKEVGRVLQSDFLTCGPEVGKFEKEFASYVGAKYAVAVSNGTAALHLACLAAGLRQGDELITSPMSFAASANCALYCNAKPVFVDIKENGLIDEKKIEKSITNKTKIIIPVHYGGLPCDMEHISRIAKKHNIIVIEDACHAIGAKYKGSRIGDCKYSDMAVFSFHPVKHITTGEGGMITTNSIELYEKLLMLRNHGITSNHKDFVNSPDGLWHREMQVLGYNYRITDFQCALGSSQLKKVDKFIEKRRKIAKKYDDSLGKCKNIEIIRESESPECFNPYHLYVIKLKDSKARLAFFEFMASNNVICQVHYIPIYKHPYYQQHGYKKVCCLGAEEFYNRIISIPIYYELTDKEQEKVIGLIKEFDSSYD
jgi:UDP-4-amino-4,6-dideoxy-N-acetyl-beta-L-altrosamine transaminase